MSPERGRFLKRILGKENPPELSWNDRPVSITRYERTEDVPIAYRVMGALLGGIAPDGLFVNYAQDGISIVDTRKALGMEIEEETDQEFVTRVLDNRENDEEAEGGKIFFVG